MQLFFAPTLTAATESFCFDKSESRHIVKVLRKKEGDGFYITNGKGMLFRAVVTLANDKFCRVTVDLVKTEGYTRDYYLHIAVAPVKNNSRYEWFLEKATEIGVDEITPIICENSEKQLIKTERMRKIIQEAMKQSLKIRLPMLRESIPFNDFIKQSFDGQLFVAHCGDTVKKSIKTLLAPKRKTTVLIGPEGDFSTDEIHTAVKKGFIPVSLGKSRLRTETAAVVACHSVAFVNEQE